MTVTTYGTVSQRTAGWAATEMLEHARPVLVLQKFGHPKPVPKNKADNVVFRRPVPFAVSTTPLAEGVTPSAQAMSYADVPVPVLQFGFSTIITDRVHDMAEDPVLRDASMLIGEQMAETLELVTWGVLRGGTSVVYANDDGTPLRTEINASITINTLRATVRYLQAQRGKQVKKMISGSPNENTTPIEPAFIAFGHTDLAHDIRTITGFVPVAKYGQMKPCCPEELGAIENIRFVLSPVLNSFPNAGAAVSNHGKISTGGTNIDVYPLVLVAQDAFGLITLKGAHSIEPKIITPGTPSGSDPLGQRGYVSAKTYYNAVRLNETWMVRIECAATNPGTVRQV